MEQIEIINKRHNISLIDYLKKCFSLQSNFKQCYKIFIRFLFEHDAYDKFIYNFIISTDLGINTDDIAFVFIHAFFVEKHKRRSSLLESFK